MNLKKKKGKKQVTKPKILFITLMDFNFTRVMMKSKKANPNKSPFV